MFWLFFDFFIINALNHLKIYVGATVYFNHTRAFLNKRIHGL